MKTKARKWLKIGEIKSANLPYEITVHHYQPSMRYDKNPEGEEEREIFVFISVIDESKKYLRFDGSGLPEKHHTAGVMIRNENMEIDHAIKLAKLEVLNELAKDCHGQESIYSCIAAHPQAFLNKKEDLQGTDSEKKAEGILKIIESRTI